MGKTTTAPPAESRSEFDQLLDGVVPTGGMFLAPTKAHDLPLRFLGMETATSQFAIEEGNPEGVIKVLRCVRLDTNDECLLRLTSNRLLLAFQEARDTGIVFTKGTVFRVLVSGAGTKTTYRIAVQDGASTTPTPKVAAEPISDELDTLVDEIILDSPNRYATREAAIIATQAAVKRRMKTSGITFREATLAILEDLTHPSEVEE